VKPRDGRLRNHPLPHPTAPNVSHLAERGFTLLDVVIVLVVSGLLIQAVIYGQSLIETARVQALVAQQGAVTAAVLAFKDRFRAWPGDYGNTQAAIDCEGSPCAGGNDNGLVEADSRNEDIIAWTHLSAAGFLNEYFRIESPTTILPSPDNTPRNVFGGYLNIASDALWGVSTNAASRLNAKAGNHVPVEILAEIDRRIDDGRPMKGSFQFSRYSAGYDEPPITGDDRCVSVDAAEASWNVSGRQSNCGAVSLVN
jgi:type II secretory pathway pseudopilin PulG